MNFFNPSLILVPLLEAHLKASHHIIVSSGLHIVDIVDSLHYSTVVLHKFAN